MTKKSSYTQATILVIAALAIFRLWFCTQFELVGDEAYYWLWSKHLDWSYFSKGPGIAWTIFLGTKIFGDTVFGARWISVLLSAGTAWIMFKLARELFNEKVAFWSVVIAAFVPLFMIGGVVMTIDPLSVFFWALAAWLFWKNKDNTSPFAWATTGLAIGIGMLCKYTNVAELACFALFCLWMLQYRKKWKPFFIMSLVSILCLIPVLIWNAQHHWITFHHLIHRGSLDKHWQFAKNELLEFIFSQFLVFNPLLFLGLMMGFLNLNLRQIKNESYRYLFCLFFPLIIFYTILSLNKASQANWTAPSWFAGVILLVAFWQEFIQPEKKFHLLAKFAVKFTVVVSFAAFIALHSVLFIYLPDFFPKMKSDPFKRIRGAQNISHQVAEIQKQYDASFIIAGNYGYASLLAFYMPGHPQTFVPIHQGFQNQFSFWPDYSKNFKDKSAIYVSDSPKILGSLQSEFSSVELVKETFSLYHGKPVDKFYFFYCQNFKRGKNE